MKKHVLLAGGFHKTKALAGSLLERGFAITIINKESHSCSILADQFPSLTIIHGDATKPFILEEANAENIDIAIALTQRDDENLVICELCKKKFHVEKTVSLVNDPKKIDFFYQSGVDSVVCAITTVANIIEHEAIMEEMGTSIPIGAGHIRIVEVPISGGFLPWESESGKLACQKKRLSAVSYGTNTALFHMATLAFFLGIS